MSQTSYYYSGRPCTPAVTVKDDAGNVIADSNYTVTYENNVNLGTATVIVEFTGNYSGTQKLFFPITPGGANGEENEVPTDPDKPVRLNQQADGKVKTGDENDVIPWIILMTGALLAGSGAVALIRRRQKEEK